MDYPPTSITQAEVDMTHATAQRCARLAGILLLISLAAGGFGEMYVPARLGAAWAHPAPTAQMEATLPLLRLGFAGYLAEALCDVALTLLFYALLRPVQRDLSLLAAFFGLMGTSVFAASELCFYAASLVVGHGGTLSAFTPAQVQALAGLFLRIYAMGSSAFLAFGGVGALVLGYLVWRSGYLPRPLGLLLALGGLGFVLRTFALLLAPAWNPDLLLMPTPLAMLSLAVWLLWRGVGAVEWDALAPGGSRD